MHSNLDSGCFGALLSLWVTNGNDDNSAKTFVLAVTKLLSSIIKIAYADDKLSFLDVNNSAVTYYIIGDHKCPLFLFC